MQLCSKHWRSFGFPSSLLQMAKSWDTSTKWTRKKKLKSQRKVSLSSSVHNSTMQQHKQLLMESMKSFLTLSHQTFDLHTHSLLDTLARMKMIVAPFDGTGLVRGQYWHQGYMMITPRCFVTIKKNSQNIFCNCF